MAGEPPSTPTTPGCKESPTTGSQILASFGPRGHELQSQSMLRSIESSTPRVLSSHLQDETSPPFKTPESKLRQITSTPNATSPTKSSGSKRRYSVVEIESDEETQIKGIASPRAVYPSKRKSKSERVDGEPNPPASGHECGQKEVTSEIRAPDQEPLKLNEEPEIIELDKAEFEKALPPIRSSRNGKVHAKESDIFLKRAKFLLHHKECFIPLLPKDNNYFQQQQKETVKASLHPLNSPQRALEHVQVHPYETIEEQPKGIKAILKPHQLEGLSFLVFLHNNGLSGILGDEMGLGKTLQTLSLFQYLKERDPKGDILRETRPFLVICPLSVLSSWITEARKWTPGLRTVRFHGPLKERTRLKRVIEGKEDVYGNEMLRPERRKGEQKTATGKILICLDSDSDEQIVTDSVDLVVTTYETFQTEQSWFRKAFVWRYVVLDEGHRIKNELSQLSNSLQSLPSEYRLILTGTPLQNNLAELWALLHWLYPEVFTNTTNELFRLSFDLGKGTIDTVVLDHSRHLLELIMIRRLKNSPGVNIGLPPKIEVLLYVPLTPMQRFWYTRLITRTDQGLLDDIFLDASKKEMQDLAHNVVEDNEHEDTMVLDDGRVKEDKCEDSWSECRTILQQSIANEDQDSTKKSAWQKLMNLVLQLRKCCNHPYMLPNAAPEPWQLGEHIIRASGKFCVLDKLIEELVIKQRKKVLIFSGFTSMLDLCEDFLLLKGGDGREFAYTRLDGATVRARRNLAIRLFNNTASNCRVILISTRAGGLGINLATGSDVIMLDQDWNPQIMLQAEARAHRIGQVNPVTIYKLCTQGTVEEQMMGRINKKLYLSAKVTESMRDIHTPTRNAKKRGRANLRTAEEMPQMNAGELITLVRRGAQTLAHEDIDANEMLSWTFETMLQKCKQKATDNTDSGESTAAIGPEREQEWLSEMERIETCIFNGKKLTRGRKFESNADISNQWAREERRTGKNTTVMVDGFAVSKESMSCGKWEAVPTLAGKDPGLAKVHHSSKPAIVNQEHCQVCWDGGNLICCYGCPRSYHVDCLDDETKSRTITKQGNLYCPQHQCFDCLQKTANAGGLIYRCRWCERGFCEDCLDWDNTVPIGNNLLEYEILGFPEVNQAFYISCPVCTTFQREDASAREFQNTKAAEYEKEWKSFRDAQSKGVLLPDEGTPALTSHPASLTDATTLEDSGVNTPGNTGIDAEEPELFEENGLDLMEE